MVRIQINEACIHIIHIIGPQISSYDHDVIIPTAALIRNLIWISRRLK